jgi:hypothetical protein
VDEATLTGPVPLAVVADVVVVFVVVAGAVLVVVVVAPPIVVVGDTVAMSVCISV